MAWRTSKKLSGAALLLMPALFLLACTATASQPRCEDPPAEVVEVLLADVDLEALALDEAEIRLEVERAVRSVAREIDRVRLRVESEQELLRATPELRRWLRALREQTAPVNPYSQAVISVARVPARGVSIAKQVVVSLAKIVARLIAVVF